MKVGEIYQEACYKSIGETEVEKRKVRIIGLDEFEVFYDPLRGDKKWTFSGNFQRKSSFYRMATTAFKTKMELVDCLALTEQEYLFFRPDLPMRFGRLNNIDWKIIAKEGIECLPTDFLKTKIALKKLMLIPFGPKGGIRKSELVEKDENLTLSTLIKTALKIQKPIAEQENKGIGFFRFGFEKGIPSYYIGAYLDKAGFLKD